MKKGQGSLSPPLFPLFTVFGVRRRPVPPVSLPQGLTEKEGRGSPTEDFIGPIVPKRCYVVSFLKKKNIYLRYEKEGKGRDGSTFPSIQKEDGV